MATQKYLDYAGLTHLANNYIINKKIGTTVGDILYVSSVNAQTGVPTYNRLGIGTNGKVLKVVSGVPAWADDSVITYSAGTGLSLSGYTFNHSNAVTAQTTQALYPIKIDAQGHISAYGSAVTALKNPYALKFFAGATELTNKYDGSALFDIIFSNKFNVANTASEDGGISVDLAYTFNTDQFTLASSIYSINTITNQEIEELFEA